MAALVTADATGASDAADAAGNPFLLFFVRLLPTAITAFLLSASTCVALDPKLESSLAYYRDKYPLQDPVQELVDDKGQVPPEFKDAATLNAQLSGVRNFRYVLNGLLYRGGKINPKGNEYPMSTVGLNNICEQGFARAIYLYSKHMYVGPPAQCTPAGTTNSEQEPFGYKSLPPLSSDNNVVAILSTIREAIDGPDHRPIYVHCYNGWHASGYISALALRQFCGFSPQQAIAYWDINTDGVCTGGYNWVRKKIASFSPSDKLKINEEQRKAVCPTATFLLDPHSPTALSIEGSGTIFRVNEGKYCGKSWNNAKVR